MSLGPPTRLLPLACHLGASEADPLPFVGSGPALGGRQEGAAGPGSETAAGLWAPAARRGLCLRAHLRPVPLRHILQRRAGKWPALGCSVSWPRCPAQASRGESETRVCAPPDQRSQETVRAPRPARPRARVQVSPLCCLQITNLRSRIDQAQKQ